MKKFVRWKFLRWVLVGLATAFVGIQIIPADRSNPPVESEVPASDAVRAILRRSCYDCHSNETVWPWYSKVAPVSWLVAHDVHDGRKELNFSTWNRYTPEQRQEKLRESWEQVEEGEMPLWFYLPTHREASLSSDDRKQLRNWALGTAPTLRPHRGER